MPPLLDLNENQQMCELDTPCSDSCYVYAAIRCDIMQNGDDNLCTVSHERVAVFSLISSVFMLPTTTILWQCGLLYLEASSQQTP